MHKVLFGGLLLALAASTASADFTAVTWLPPDSEPQQSFSSLQALTFRGGGGEQITRNALPIPYNDSMSARGRDDDASSRAYARETYSFTGSELRLDLTNFERTGMSTLESGGNWIFTVSTPTLTVASGFFSVVSKDQPPGVSSGFALAATLQDLTAGVTLFDSYQGNLAPEGTFVVGGLTGQQPTFSGSLTNLLDPQHTYRFAYFFLSSQRGTAGDSSAATGLVMLSAVPEPTSLLMALAGLIAVAGYATARRRTALHALA